jgi:hypothetical protein
VEEGNQHKSLRFTGVISYLISVRNAGEKRHPCARGARAVPLARGTRDALGTLLESGPLRRATLSPWQGGRRELRERRGFQCRIFQTWTTLLLTSLKVANPLAKASPTPNPAIPSAFRTPAIILCLLGAYTSVAHFPSVRPTFDPNKEALLAELTDVLFCLGPKALSYCDPGIAQISLLIRG